MQLVVDCCEECSLYVGSKACVRVGNELSEWFPVRVGLRQGCVMSPWLLIFVY